MSLAENWFLEGALDFELQKYRLLAYLQEVRHAFRDHRLYPELGELTGHYRSLLCLRDRKRALQAAFPRSIEQIDLSSLQLRYRSLEQDDPLATELTDIIGYAAAQMRPSIEEGTVIREYVEKKLQLEPVGISPLYKDEGYLLVRCGEGRPVSGYYYTATLFEQAGQRGLRIQYVGSWPSGIAYTPVSIKKELARSRPQLPNPAVYSAYTPLRYPFHETVLPVARQMLIRYLAAE